MVDRELRLLVKLAQLYDKMGCSIGLKHTYMTGPLSKKPQEHSAVKTPEQSKQTNDKGLKNIYTYLLKYFLSKP